MVAVGVDQALARRGTGSPSAAGGRRDSRCSRRCASTGGRCGSRSPRGGRCRRARRPRARSPRGRSGWRCRACCGRSSPRRGSSAPPRPRRRRPASARAARAGRCAAACRRSGRAAPRAASCRRPCRRSAGAATPVSIAAFATAAGISAEQARIERHRDDVVRPELRPDALIGGGDLVGHVLAGERGQRLRRGDLHLVVDRAWRARRARRGRCRGSRGRC